SWPRLAGLRFGPWCACSLCHVPMAFVVWAVRYHLEWFIRRKDPQPVEEQKSISECGENRKLDELLDQDHTQVVNPGDTLEAVLDRNRPKEE
uniref:Small integral membrane protein 12 n=2 Tax=Monodon monoceros TaxID=40151 RepID=A0A8C6BU96_MONMO